MTSHVSYAARIDRGLVEIYKLKVADVFPAQLQRCRHVILPSFQAPSGAVAKLRTAIVRLIGDWFLGASSLVKLRTPRGCCPRDSCVLVCSTHRTAGHSFESLQRLGLPDRSFDHRAASKLMA